MPPHDDIDGFVDASREAFRASYGPKREPKRAWKYSDRNIRKQARWSRRYYPVRCVYPAFRKYL